jgi:acyl transferase domain-containing protein/acyl carrier protein
MGKVEENHETGFEIAVIGMAGRFPGAKNIDEFWDNIKNGVESISYASDEEIAETGIEPELKNDANYVKALGGVLEDKEFFDASFFGYTPKEAEVMEPQMRIFHECVWEALENAGYDPETYNKSIGIYAGSSTGFYWQGLALLSGKRDELGQFEAELFVNNSFMCNLISYRLNLVGPSVNLHTACSTSLVAIHLACQGILNGECDIAIAGGVSVEYRKQLGYVYQEDMILSPDGHCRTFDQDAKGTIGGEGSGVVVLKFLQNAIAQRDQIHAVIKGTATNNDGKRKVSFTAPSIKGQSEVIHAAHQMAEIEPESICYLEAHGTGTPLGDTVEIEGLKKAFNTPKKGFCAIGSVKTNVGHLGAAAGVTGVIKTVLMLKHKLICPSLNFQAPNQKIDFENSPFYVNTQLKELRNDKYPLRAGVSSFGIGGTNAHVVLEEAPTISQQATEDRGQGIEEEKKFRLILLSANTQSVLDKMKENLLEYLKKNPGIRLADAAYTLQIGRKTFKHRQMTVVSTINEAVDALSPGTGKMQTFFTPDENRAAVFMFPGLGSQYVNMGLELYEKELVFRETMDQCFEILKSLLGYNIKRILYPHPDCRGESPCPPKTDFDGAPGPDNSRRAAQQTNPLSQIEIAQVVIFIVEYALARMLIKWGIKPQAMIGYSFGEYAAACLAEVFSLEDALSLIVKRGELLKKAPVGAMLSVPLPEEELKTLINSELSIAVDNGSSCIVAGSTDAIEAFEKQMRQKRLLGMRLEASHAIHSQMMVPILKEYEKTVGQFDLKKPVIPYISNVTGNWITVEQATNPRYWSRHLHETVRFAAVIKELKKVDNAVFVEVGPGRDLCSMLARHIGEHPEQKVINLIPAPGKVVSDLYYMLNKIGRLWLLGVKIDWYGFYSYEKRNRVPLPTYPFESQRYWINENHFKKGEEMKSQQPFPRDKDIADWFYVPQWNRLMLPPGNSSDIAKGSRWLVFIDETGFGSKMVNLLKKKDMEVLEVKGREAFNRLSDHAYTINPREPEDYLSLIKELRTTNKIPRYVLHFWGITNPGPNVKELERAEIERAQYSGFYSLVYLAKAIGKQNISNDIQIAAVTNNVHSVTGEELLRPEKITGLAPIKIIPQEYPNLTCRSMDIVLPKPGTRQEERLLEQLLEELMANSSDTVIAYRNNYRWIQQFQPVRLEKRGEDIPRLRENGHYLITGGLGNIGLKLAESLVKRVKAKLVLTSRTKLPSRDKWEKWLSTHPADNQISRKILKLQALEAMGGEVLALSADVANQERMHEVITQAEERFGDINGVIHAAGLTDPGAFRVVAELTEAECARHFQPKIYGLLVLKNILKDKELDFCLLISSLAPILGGLSFVAYAAANLFMDAFVYLYNRTNTVKWIDVNWGDWQFGKVENRSVAQLTMTPEEGIKTFENILHHYQIDQVIVSKVDLQTRIDKWIKLESVRGAKTTQKETLSSLHPRPNLLNPYVEPRNQVEHTIADIWQMILGYNRLGSQDDFFELGGDSLKAITVISRIHKKLDAALTLREFFNRPTIEGLSEYIASAKESSHNSIEPVEKKEYYPLSSEQKRLYILQEIYKNSIAYNETQTVELVGGIDKKNLEEIFKKLIYRHESWRTSIIKVEDEPVQVIHEDVEFEIQYYDITENQFKSKASSEIIKSFVRPFNLSMAPFLNVLLIKFSEKVHLVVLDMHHIITDGVSNEIFFRELMAFYSGKMLPQLRLQYRDYSEWQNSKKNRNVIQQQEAYWLDLFRGQIPKLNLPLDFPRPELMSFKGNNYEFKLAKPETGKLKQMCAENGVTLYMSLLAIFNVLLYKYTGQEDIIVGSGIAGRRHADLQDIIGMFVNSLVMRNWPEGQKSYRQFLQEVKVNTLSAFENQDFQFEELIDKLHLGRDFSRNPLFDVSLLLQNIESPAAGKNNGSARTANPQQLQLLPYNYVKKVSKFDICLYATEVNNEITFDMEYSTALFKEFTIEKMALRYREILEQVVENKEIKLQDIKISSDLASVQTKVQDYQGGFNFD